MNRLDYRRRDFKEIKTDNNEKKYFIRINKKFIEVPIEIYRLYRADYMRAYRTQIRDIEFIQGNYKDDSFLSQHTDSIKDMDKYYIDLIDKKDSIHNLLVAMKQLDKEQYFIIYLLFFEEETESSIAKKLNISQQAVNRKKKKILLLLKKMLLKK